MATHAFPRRFKFTVDLGLQRLRARERRYARQFIHRAVEGQMFLRADPVGDDYHLWRLYTNDPDAAEKLREHFAAAKMMEDGSAV